jgi:hypothetical protein
MGPENQITNINNGMIQSQIKKSRFLLNLARARFSETAAEYFALAGALVASAHYDSPSLF